MSATFQEECDTFCTENLPLQIGASQTETIYLSFQDGLEIDCTIICVVREHFLE